VLGRGEVIDHGDLRKEDHTINTNYNNCSWLLRKISFKERRKEREIPPNDSLLGWPWCVVDRCRSK
jgi:hypothetical protein